MTIGNKISFCRKRTGMSQETLAAKLSISRQAVSRWERGEAIPDTEKVIQLSRLFNVSTDYLLLDEIEEQQTEENPPDNPENSLKERRRNFRIWFGKGLLVSCLLAFVITLIGAGIYASNSTEWYTAWGRYGSALFRTWMIVPLILSLCGAFAGGNVLWREYLRED